MTIQQGRIIEQQQSMKNSVTAANLQPIAFCHNFEFHPRHKARINQLLKLALSKSYYFPDWSLSTAFSLNNNPIEKKVRNVDKKALTNESSAFPLSTPGKSINFNGGAAKT